MKYALGLCWHINNTIFQSPSQMHQEKMKEEKKKKKKKKKKHRKSSSDSDDEEKKHEKLKKVLCKVYVAKVTTGFFVGTLGNDLVLSEGFF